MKIIKLNSQDSEKFSNTGVSAITLNVIALASAVNTAITSGSVNPSAINVEVVLNRAGKDFTICQSTCDFLLKACNFFSQSYEALGNAGYEVLELHTSTVKETIIVPYFLALGGVIQLQGSDELRVKVSFGTDTFDSSIDATNSYIELDIVESHAPEYGTPKISVVLIEAGQSSRTYPLPNNTNNVTFVNLDKATPLESIAPLQQFSLNHSAGKLVQTFRQMINIRMSKLPTNYERAHTNVLFTADTADGISDGNVTLSLKATNVASSKNALVIFHRYFDERLLVKSAEHANLIAAHAHKGTRRLA